MPSETTPEEDRRQKLLTQIAAYFSPISLLRLEEEWANVQTRSTQRSQMILYIVENHLDPEVPTAHHPTRVELENLPTAKLQEIMAQIQATVKELKADA